MLVAAFHALVIYAFVSGLAAQLVQKFPIELKAQIIPPSLESTKPIPLPPPPKFVEPYVPPPVITIQTQSQSAITVQNKVVSPSAQSVVPVSGPTAPLGSTHNCDAYYPPISQRLNEQGKVLVRYNVSADGTISGVTVLQSSGLPNLDQAALQCVQEHWKNAPAVQNGKPVASTSEAVVSFELQ
jgi:protein TonB